MKHSETNPGPPSKSNIQASGSWYKEDHINPVPQEVEENPTLSNSSKEFEAVWQAIKGWDLERSPGAGYAGATGDDVQTILKALEPIHHKASQELLRQTLLRLRSHNGSVIGDNGRRSEGWVHHSLIDAELSNLEGGEK